MSTCLKLYVLSFKYGSCKHPPHSFYYTPSRSNHSNGNSANVNYLLNRGVKYLYHFTRISNLQSILDYGVLPINDLQAANIKYLKNDPLRNDDNLNATSISVSFPNHKLFYKFRKSKSTPENRWCVLEIDVEVLNEVAYKCYKHNAARNDTPTCTISDMFGNSSNEYPEDVQAEIMIQGAIPSPYIETIYVDYPYGPASEVRQIVSNSELTIPVVKSHKYFTVRMDEE